ncbi:DUF6651 domain-containing protein [Enterobacter hormaechei]|uniref:DUF6651 domain-containing protein n=1 Tax=Enterobacter hormaechei TaxID=158836 RepID=UPI0022F089C7|nr:DUF6651 domain-containing protein [Enterobacter hormaechei]MDA4785099.1 hypothetical protein [Enterobacter hormaechei]
MKLKLDANGNVVVENGMPVYIHDDGKEIPFDAVAAMTKITSLNGEAKTHREAKEAAEANLAKFSGISDPAKALEALEMMTKIDQKKLIDAGAVDQVKAEITKVFQQQLDEANGKTQQLESQLYDEMIGGRFGGSKFISEKMAIPSEFVRSYFGQNFKIEGGKVVAYDGQGNKVFSRTKPGELASFDEALESLVESHPQKDYILKSSGNSGGGSHQSQHQAGQKTMKRAAFDALPPAEQQAAIGGGTSIVD